MRHLLPIACLMPAITLGAAALPDGTVPASCGVQLKAGNCDAASLDQVKQLGVKWVRRGFVWGQMEKEKDVYDFSRHDALMDDAKARGLSVLGDIALNSPFHPTANTPEGRVAFARFAAAVVERYKGRDVIWEIWNEPNVRTFWGKHGKANTVEYATEYTALVKEVMPAIRAVDPACVVMAGSVSCLGWSAVDPWMEACFAQGILGTGIDAWSVHPYSLRRPEDYGAAYASLRAMLARHGAPADFPILNSERGYPITEAEGWTGGEGDMKEFQAWHLVRQYLNDQMAGIRLTSWYELSGNEGFSLLDGGTRLPAFTACQVMLAQLDGMRFAKRQETASPQDYVLLFTGPAGTTLVAWTAPEAGKTPDQAVVHDLAIPVAASGVLTVVDIQGGTRPVTVRDGVITLTLGGGPQYVALGK